MTTEIKVNPHFEDFIFDWNYKFYFLVGGYGSGKSHSVALKLILKLIEEQRTALVVRNVFDTHRESTFSLMFQIISELNLHHFVKFNISPLKITFKNGSVIIFKGMDKPEKLKSINNISIVWLEECPEIPYAGFKELLGRVRHPFRSLHFILSCNPVDMKNWTFKHFLEGNELDKKLYKERMIKLNDIYYHHSTAFDNMFLTKDYINQLKELEKCDKDLYRIAYLGQFGANGVKVLPNFSVEKHDKVMEYVNECNLFRVGMDFGFETSFNAVVRVAVDSRKQSLYIYWEYYKNHLTDNQLAEDLEEFRKSGELIIADSAEPKTIAFFKQQGFKMTGAKKFPHSRIANVKKLRRFYTIVCSDQCLKTINELSDLIFAKDKNGDIIYDTFNCDPHTLSAIWYALDGYEVADLKERNVISKRMR